MNGNDTFLDIRDAHLRVTSGNVYASAFNLDQIDIVMSSNTASTVNFNNPTKAFNAASNIEVGTANLFVDTSTSRVGVGTASPATTLDVAGDLNVSGNLTIIGTTTTLDTDHLRVQDPIIELGKDNTGSPFVDLGLLMTRPAGSSNVGIIFDESANTLEIGYTQGNASDSTITMQSAATEPLSVNVNGTISGNGSGLTALNATNITTGTLDRNTTGSAATLTTPRSIGGVNFDGSADIVPTTFGAATFDTDTLVVDSVNDRVGIGTTSPDNALHIRNAIPAVLLDDSDDDTKVRITGGVGGDLYVDSNWGGSGNTGDIIFREASSEKMRITGSGDVGIGVVIPGGKLDVRGSVSDPSIPTVHIGDNASDFGDYGMVNLVRNPTESGTKAHLAFIRNGNTIFSQGYYNNTNTFGFWPSFSSVVNTPAMAFATNGNVGIGTTVPTSKLNVQGTISTGRNLAREVGSVIAYSSQYQSARGAANVINGRKNFEHGTSDWITSSGNRVNAYVVIDLGASYSVDRLVIYNQNEYSDSKREVKQFKLQGSTDNSTWVDVIGSECGRSNADEPNPGWSFRIPQSWDDDNEGSSSYRYWKFIMETFHGTDSYGGIMELELYENNEAVHSEVSTSSLVAQDVYSEMGNFSRGVGIGTTSPSRKLDVVGGPTKSDGFILGTSNNIYYPGCIYTDTNWGMLFRSARENPGIADFVFNDYAGSNMMVINNGNVGINQNSPTAKLHIKPNHTSYSNPSDPVGAAGVAVYNETNSDPTITHSIISLRTGGSSGGDPFVSFDVAGEHGWSIGIDNSAGTQLRFAQSWANFDNTRAYISVNSTADEINFTGQHRSFVSNVPHTEYLNLEGLIVSANKNQYFDIQEEIVTGVQAIKINESLPLVSISNVAYDKSCFGVISGSEDTNDREYSQGSFVSVLKKQEGDIRAHINSVGEGAIWVTNLNGTLESGDYITTSNIAGYGQKQDSEFLANYTVAKITMDCDFNPSTQPTRIIKRELQDVNYWVKYTYDDISEEEYTRVENLGRRVRIIESGTEISQEEYENHVKKEGYTITESNTYIRNETTYQRVFSDKEKEPREGYELEVRNEPVNVLDEHGQIQWEDDPSGATEKAYKIRYLDADGSITDEANHVYKAAFVGCTYHCG